MKVFIINSLDKHYGSTYRARAFYKALQSLGIDCFYSEANYCDSRGTGNVFPVKQYGNIFSYFIAALQRVFLCLRLGYDVCIIQKVLPVTLPAALACLLRGKRVIVDWDDLEAGFHNGVFTKFLILLTEKLFCILPVEFITHSRYIKDYAYRLGIKDITIIPQIADKDILYSFGVDYDSIRKKYNLQNAFIFGYIATLTKGGIKDINMILGLYKQIEKVCPQAALLIVGGGPLAVHAHKLIKSYALRRALITGFVEHHSIADFIRACDAGIICMSDDHSNRARVSLKLIEYCALNKPVIGEVVGETKDLFGSYVYNIEETKGKLGNKDNFLEWSRLKTYEASEKISEEFNEESLSSLLQALLAKNGTNN